MNDDISCTGNNILIDFIFTFTISTCVYFSPAHYCIFDGDHIHMIFCMTL